MKGNYLVMYTLYWDALRSRHGFCLPCCDPSVFKNYVMQSSFIFVLFEIFIILLYFFSLEKEQRKNDIKFKRAIVIKHFSS